MHCNGSNWAVYSPGSWDGFRNDVWALWAGVIMRLEHHLVGGYVLYIHVHVSPHIIIIIIITLAESCCRGQNQSTACFDCWPKCAHRGIFYWFLSFLTILNNTRQYFYQSKTVDSFWPVNVLTTRKVWQCLTCKCTRYTLGSTCISTFWVILTLVVVGGLIN